MPQSVAEQFKAIPMSSNLAESLERARGFSRAQAHRAVLLEHLLLALIEDPDAGGVLRASNIDPVKLGTDVSDYLGRLLEDMRAEPGTEPYADVELHRVLQAAGQAAQQSRRRQIDGAIVLAAIVGDGKSPAAGLLKTLGLSFEEAIKALQKASAQARSKQFATPPKATAPAPVRESLVTAVEPPAPSGTRNKEEIFSEPMPAQPEQPQTVEEILAAARARIQRRSGSVGGKSEPSAATLEGDLEASPAPSALARRAPPDSEPDDALAALPENMPPPSGPAEPPSPAQSARAGFVPSSPPPGPQLPRSVPPTVASPEPRAFPNQGHQRQPPPFQGGPALKPGLPTRLPGATRHPLTEGPRSLPNGAGGHHLPSAPSAMGKPTPRPAQRSGAGPLIETIPRRMRVGIPAPAQVRIDREKIEGLILLLLGPRAANLRPDAFLTRALTIRLIAPDGGFWIESEAPETQWVEPAPGIQQDESAIWRWNVTPHRQGRYRLLLAVTARAVGRDGLTAETSPPDRAIEVVVKRNVRYSMGRGMGLLAAVIAGAAIGRFGPEIWAFSGALIKRLTGG
jgi:neural Wiskott-Aldrich syndrome protein